MQDMSNKTFILTRLTLIAGCAPHAWNDQCIAWHGDDDYWLRLLDMHGDGQTLLIHLDQDMADEMNIYSVMGFVLYNEIDFSVTPWDEFNSGEKFNEVH